MLDQKSYINTKFNNCPACNSNEISSGGLQADGNVAYSDVECNDCDLTWTDEYKLTQYIVTCEGDK